MPKYRIKNGSGRGRAFKVRGGVHIVPAGKTETVDVKGELSEGFIAGQRAAGVLIEGAETRGRKPAAETPDTPKPAA